MRMKVVIEGKKIHCGNFVSWFNYMTEKFVEYLQ